MTQADVLSKDARVFATSGIHNFRDYGAYPTRNGGRLVSHTLFRSGEHAQATAEDLDIVDRLSLSTVFDLRGTAEREKAPSRSPQGFAAHIVYAQGETTQAAAPHLQAAATSFDADTARRDMCARYSDVPFRPILVEVYRRYFDTLARSSSPNLIYCTAGKDRTGVLVALLHTAVGVHRDDLFEDYLLTNTVGDVEARVDALKADLQSRFGARMSDDAIRVVTSVEPAFLQHAFDAMVRECGSVDSYLERVLLVSPEARQAIVDNYVV